ncbi:MAG: DUF4976 domain-containing protein, partial [Candidatus Thorarchaeota archaeon]
RSRAAANAKLKIWYDMTIRDYKREPPKGLDERDLVRWAYQRYIKDYLRCVASIDDNVGRLLNTLDEQGLTDDTVVIYTSDQGMFLGEHSYFDKRFMFEESLQMPFTVRFPPEIRPRTVNDDIILNIDFAPTFLDFAGAKIPNHMQGRSFRSILQGKTPEKWRTSMYYRYWMHLTDHWVPAHYGVRTKRFKLIYYYGQPLGMRGSIPQQTEPEWELFDLEKDPYEMENVYGDPSCDEILNNLKSELKQLRKETRDSR